MSTNLEGVIRDILEEGLTDWVPIDRIVGAAREAAPTEGSDFREIASEVVSRLIKNELMVPGSIGSVGFERWPGPPGALFDRVIAECESFNWQPQGGGCWLANTDKGDGMVDVK